MASEVSETGNAFAQTACKLLIEYTARLLTQRQEAVKILDRFHDSRGTVRSSMDAAYLRGRYEQEKDQFYRSREVFKTLIRKASQWIEHGKTPKPHLEMELQLRLADFESTLQSMEDFFNSNYI